MARGSRCGCRRGRSASRRRGGWGSWQRAQVALPALTSGAIAARRGWWLWPQPPRVVAPRGLRTGPRMTPFLKPAEAHDPRRVPLPLAGENAGVAGAVVGVVDFDAVLADARRRFVCAECGAGLTRWQRASAHFCSPQCRYRFRDRRRYAEDPEGARARARAYYAANRERVLEKAAAKRGTVPASLAVNCSECGGQLEGRQRVVCSPRCREARFRRLHPDAYAAKEARKVERRRLKRREGAGL